MRILMVTFTVPYPEAVSGAALVMHGQLAALSARHELTIATFAASDNAGEKALEQLRASGVKVHVLREVWPTRVIRWKRCFEEMVNQFRGRHPWLKARAVDQKMQHALNRLLSQNSFDLIQVEDIGVANYHYATNIPSVLTEHEVGRSLPGEPEEWQELQPAIWRQFDRIQVFTPRDAAAIQAVAPEVADRVRVNPFGIDIPEEADPRLEEPGEVVFVGGFDHPPNVDAALWIGNEIMPSLRVRSPGVRLTIVGNSPPRAVQLLSSDDVIVTGRVLSIDPYLERAAVVLAPVRLGGGMRVKVLQAMARGKAVVTTGLGTEGLHGASHELPLLIGETANEIAQATAALLSSDQERHALGRRARRFVMVHHSWSAYGERLEAMYAELQPKRQQV